VAVRSDVLVHQSVAHGASNVITLATVPAGEVWLVKQICCDNRTGSAITGMAFHLRSGTSVKIWQGAAAVSTPAIDKAGFAVLEAGDTIQVLSTIAGTVFWAFYGARLVT
jgi:hypothetical protein